MLFASALVVPTNLMVHLWVLLLLDSRLEGLQLSTCHQLGLE